MVYQDKNEYRYRLYVKVVISHGLTLYLKSEIW